MRRSMSIGFTGFCALAASGWLVVPVGVRFQCKRGLWVVSKGHFSFVMLFVGMT